MKFSGSIGWHWYVDQCWGWAGEGHFGTNWVDRGLALRQSYGAYEFWPKFDHRSRPLWFLTSRALLGTDHEKSRKLFGKPQKNFKKKISFKATKMVLDDQIFFNFTIKSSESSLFWLKIFDILDNFAKNSKPSKIGQTKCEKLIKPYFRHFDFFSEIL